MVDERLFGDVSSFSACPICQFQVDELTGSEEVRHDFKSITPFKVLELADETYVRDRAFGLLSRSSSLSLDERKFVRKVIDHSFAPQIRFFRAGIGALALTI
jgi:hypothetical protein